MTTSRIEVSGVTVIKDGNPILDVAKLEVASEEIVAVVGPNGAGKSTLIQVMGLLVRPNSGHVTVRGTIANRKNEHSLRKKLACIFQSPHLLDRSVLSNVELGMQLRGVDKTERTKLAKKWLESLGLENLTDRRARTLSGGEAQRVNIARALALNPEVLLLDEPLGGLDAPTRHSLTEELGPLIRRGAGAGLIVTHDRRVALALGDRVAVMLDGQIRQVAPPEVVFGHPVDEDVASFVGVENILPAVASGNQIKLDGGPTLIADPGTDGEILVSLRAEEVRPIHPGNNIEEPNILSGTVIRIFKRGVGFGAEIDAGVKLISRLTRADQSILNIEPGNKISVHIRPRALHRIAR